MNTNKKILLMSIAVFVAALSSCTQHYAQIYTISPVKNQIQLSENLVFENQDITVLYNFWAPSGVFEIAVRNKTTEVIQINLDKSFFTYNGFAMDYFNDGLHQNHKTNYLNIPPNASRRVQTLELNQKLFFDCDLKQRPKHKLNSQISFDENNSPALYGSIIRYKSEKTPIEQEKNVQQTFFVSKITNFRTMDILEFKEKLPCESRNTIAVERNTQQSNNRFYIDYN